MPAQGPGDHHAAAWFEVAVPVSIQKPEILAPAGNWAMLSAAVQHGADAVYLGVEQLNMRAKAGNFALPELPEICRFCHSHGVSVHLTVNTVVYQNELSDLSQILAAAKSAEVDFVIAWDPAVMTGCLEHGLDLCVSTQASISNASSAEFYRNLGARRCVLARECTLSQIREIRQATSIELETFVHGAMCVAVSGRCFMSHSVFRKSANRGACVQPCRKKYRIIDEDNHQLLLGENYVLSPKDLCALPFLPELIESGIQAFKIEGRMRSPEYVAVVTDCYRQARDLYYQGSLTEQRRAELVDRLATVYNRGFSRGFYYGMPDQEDYSERYGSAATTRKVQVGEVVNYFVRAGIAHIKVDSNGLQVGDLVYIIGPTTGVLEFTVEDLRQDEIPVTVVTKGEDVTLPCPDRVRQGDGVFKRVWVDPH